MEVKQNQLNLKHFQSQKPHDLGEDGLKTWSTILGHQEKFRNNQIYSIFNDGVKSLNLNSTHLPDLNLINLKLKAQTGFQGIYVDGLEDASSFYQMLAQRLFPIGNFIRNSQDVNYTPAPDIVHDLYGHIPFLMNSDYAIFCQKYGEMTSEFFSDSRKLQMWERFFWFTVEFGLIKTKNGLRIFGAGIASSIGECEYALSGKPKFHPFNIEAIIHHDFRIDMMQTELFVLENEQQLYSSLNNLYLAIKNS